jgi:hypothetical protein
MKKFPIALTAVIPIALFLCACYLILFAPPEPGFDWRLHMSVAEHGAIVSHLNHLFTTAAYTITWAIQLGYLTWLGFKWRSQKQAAARSSR